MKLLIDQSSDYEDVEITVKCGVIDARLEKLIALIRLYSFSIIGKKDGRSYSIALHDIYYFETVDDRTFLGAISTQRENAGSLRQYDSRGLFFGIWYSSFAESSRCKLH